MKADWPSKELVSLVIESTNGGHPLRLSRFGACRLCSLLFFVDEMKVTHTLVMPDSIEVTNIQCEIGIALCLGVAIL